jgi:hypothetical protein
MSKRARWADAVIAKNSNDRSINEKRLIYFQELYFTKGAKKRAQSASFELVGKITHLCTHLQAKRKKTRDLAILKIRK